MMRPRGYGLILGIGILAGCGTIPPGIVVASYVVDGVLVAKTGKTSVDHGISAVRNEDCVLWRGVWGFLQGNGWNKSFCQPIVPEEHVLIATDSP